MALIARLSVDESIRDILITLPDEAKDDVDGVVDFLREIVKPNTQCEKFHLLKRCLRVTQGSLRHAEYVHSFEKLLNRLKMSGISMDAQVAAYILLNGLSDANQKDIILSLLKDLQYTQVRQAILSLSNISKEPRANNVLTTEGRLDRDFLDDGQTEGERDDSFDEESEEAYMFRKGRRPQTKRMAKGQGKEGPSGRQ